MQNISHHKKDLTNFSLDILRKSEFMEGLLKKFSLLKSDNHFNQNEIFKEVLFEIKNQLFIDKKLDTVQQNIENLHAEFFDLMEEVLQTEKVNYTVLKTTKHDIDHPIGFKEGAYLKTIYIRIN